MATADPIQTFLSEVRNETPDFSRFRSTFAGPVDSTIDPPLESIWLHAAAVHREAVLTKKERSLAVRDLMKVLKTCTGASAPAKSVAAMAPVVMEVVGLVAELEWSSGKKRARKEVKGLVEEMVGYIGVCGGRSRDWRDGCGGSVSRFGDLVRVWTVGKCKDGEGMGAFLPLVSEDIWSGFDEEECDVGRLSAVVAVEAFLLKLYFGFRFGGVAENELRNWTVASITGFGNRWFYEILLKLLLESTMPSISPLNSQDEAFIKRILYDTVLLVEYGFLHPTEAKLFDGGLRSLTLTRLIVAHEAIEDARKNEDHAKAISYVSAFSRSSLVPKLIKWIANQPGMGLLSSPSVTTPQALLKWLLRLEEQGHVIFDQEILRAHAMSFEELNLAYEDQLPKVGLKNTGENLFFIDNKGEVAEDDSDDAEMEQVDGASASVDNAFASAARSMKLENNSGKKRKGSKGRNKVRTKFIKYRLHDDTAEEFFSAPKEDGASSESEVDNLGSDEDM